MVRSFAIGLPSFLDPGDRKKDWIRPLGPLGTRSPMEVSSKVLREVGVNNDLTLTLVEIPAVCFRRPYHIRSHAISVPEC